MREQALAKLFFRELEKIHEWESDRVSEKIAEQYRLLCLIFVEVTRDEKLSFTTLFARIAYAGHRYKLSKQLLFYIHNFRIKARDQRNQITQTNGSDTALTGILHLGYKVIAECIAALFEQEIPDQVLTYYPVNPSVNFEKRTIQSFKSKARVVALADDATSNQLIIIDQDYPDKEFRMQYGIADRNENFNPTIGQIKSTFQFPVTLNLLDIEIDEDEIYSPKAIVLEPDYLVDVSAISECFQSFGAAPMLYLMKKFLPFETSHYLMLGNIANFFLDELMSNPEVTFKETFPKVFRLNPLAFAIFDDKLIREIMQKSQKHFVNLRRIIKQDLKENDIEPANCFLEPSFYSEQYGIQGRLDVFYKDPASKLQAAIVELKSGKPYKSNKYGLNSNHFVQTLLYDLLIKSVYANGIAPANFILYSGVDMDQLRFAPVIKAQQMEAIQVRNQLIAIEKSLANIQDQAYESPNILDLLKPSMLKDVKGFIGKDLARFEKVYSGMRPIDRKYFLAFSSFIAREHQLAKTGMEGMESVNGLASMWLNDLEQKKSSFDIINHLTIQSCQVAEENPVIVFQKTDRTHKLANFRIGDIAVLYPYLHEQSNVLNNQIFKCTIIDITKETVTVRLRYKQFNVSLFEGDGFWNMEHDSLDMSFTGMYRQLFELAQGTVAKRDLMLTLSPPKKGSPQQIGKRGSLTEHQQAILSKMVEAEDYFLLWGPPGTGKTSRMLKEFVAYILNETDENILLLAYTNRAVDEICEAIESIDRLTRNEYLRIGSRYSTAQAFQDRLFSTHTEKINTRQELKDLIDSHRIFISTVASISNKQDLLQLKTFHRVVIDEASQILEPMLVGLLPKFEKFILIGDHKQLPAVVVQPPEVSLVKDKELQEIGLINRRHSFFERIYKRCQQQGWDWAYAQLQHQGRMHQAIMDFPSVHFYDGDLHILPEGIKERLIQTGSLSYDLPNAASDLTQLLTRRRFLFLPTKSEDSSNAKTNQYEANLVGQLIHSFQEIYTHNEITFDSNTLGIITPYRAQIACIAQEIERQTLDQIPITVDTVERYQGGARDIIIISLCTNQPAQLRALVSLSDEGVDRKLNVALTRARKHLVVIGNPDILNDNPVYRELIADCGI